jgi:predicted dehydrogenase
VKRLLDEGHIGEVLSARLYTGSHLPRWRPWQDYKLSYSADPVVGGAVLDCVHEIDLALWLLGPAKLRAAAIRKGASIGLEKTDALAELLLDHESGALGSLHLNFVQQNYSRGCEVIGASGTIRWDFSAAAVSRYGADGELAQLIELPEDYDINAMYLDELSHFLDCVTSRAQTCNPLAGGIAALEIALAAKESAA